MPVLGHYNEVQCRGDREYLKKVTECDRGGQRWYARTVKESKNTSWMDDIAREVLEVGKIYVSRSEILSLFVQ